jgi:PTH1 family peptidyl-tRNA hydrolase
MTELTEERNESSQESSIRLVVGLGNPGGRYADTRHNAGFRVADQLLSNASAWERTEWQPLEGELFMVQVGGKWIHLLKPLTYMNASGLAVRETAVQLGLIPPELLVVCDCMDLPFGRLRLKRNGRHGGQRGVASIIQELESVDFPRLRVGIGRPWPEGTDVIDYVLSPWASTEPAKLPAVIEKAADVVATAVEAGLEAAMQEGNPWCVDNINAIVQGETNIEEV